MNNSNHRSDYLIYMQSYTYAMVHSYVPNIPERMVKSIIDCYKRMNDLRGGLTGGTIYKSYENDIYTDKWKLFVTMLNDETNVTVEI